MIIRSRKAEKPFSIDLDVARVRGNRAHRLVRIGLKGREMAGEKRPASNLVFLLDVSGSMMPPERLPLVKQAMRLLVEKLTENDRVAIVVYAGGSGLALPSTSGDHKEAILARWKISRRAARPTARKESSSPTKSQPTISSRAESTASSWRPTVTSMSA